METLRSFLRGYSFDDLAKGFFALNLWLPNIASPIKSQYLYTVLEEVGSELPDNRKLNSYKEFAQFAAKIIELTPTFPMLEDYAPEKDWGDIKYYFGRRYYKIFYGGDLSNPYDYYYSFEIIHRAFSDYYADILGQSPLDELKFALDIQDEILRNIKQEVAKDESVSPGDFTVPSEPFWLSVSDFIDSYRPENLYPRELVALHAKDFTSGSTAVSDEDFTGRAFEGKNCLYFFIRKNERLYPALPRRAFSIIFDRWGAMLKSIYPEILKLDGERRKRPEIDISLELVKFLRDRFPEKDILEFASPIKGEREAQGTLFTAIQSKGRLFLIYVTPPSVSPEVVSEHLEALQPDIDECRKLLEIPPTKLALLARNQAIQFESEKEEVLKPCFITVLPSCTSEPFYLNTPKGFEGEIMGLDQFVGIMDEISNTDELSSFFEYVEELNASTRIPGLTSYLDLYGSFKDSSSVLVAGANTPNLIMLDFSWGSNFRYRTLHTFWLAFPEDDFFGHPRSWRIPADRINANGLMLDSKPLFAYAYYQKVGEATFYINAPIHKMEYQQGKVSDTMMHALADALNLYVSTIKSLGFFHRKNKFQVMFFPLSLARADEEFGHITHLVQEEHVWSMDVSRIRRGDTGVRVVFNEEMLLDSLSKATDRSMQITLLIDVLSKINSLFPEDNLPSVIQALEGEKAKKARFKSRKMEKTVAFPELISELLPEDREFKLADKCIAQFAHQLHIEPGTYSGEDAKAKVDLLIDKVVAEINARASTYNLIKSLPLLLEKTDVLIADHDRDSAMVKMSLDHEVEYERAERSSESYRRFLRHHNNFRYVIEKFVQHQSTAPDGISRAQLAELVALVDRLLDVRTASDILHYGIYPSKITIDSDFLVSISHGEDISAAQNAYSQEQARISLGEIGTESDTADIQMSLDSYLTDLDEAFRQDFTFGFRDLVNVLQILSQWPAYHSESKECAYYTASLEEIIEACAMGISEFNTALVPPILTFLELKPENLLKIEGRADLAKDLPTWEHNKRLTRYSIRPIIKVGDKYFWGPHSTNRSAKIWVGITSNHRLPAEIVARSTSAVLLAAHRSIEDGLVKKAKEIAQRFTPYIQLSVHPHKIDPSIGDNRYGDYDLLGYLKEKNVLINVESKIIDADYSLKDTQSTHKKIFFGRTRSDGRTERSDLKKVEDRAEYLKLNYSKLMSHYNWEIPKQSPRIVSIFLTRMGYFWTKSLPYETDVHFIQIKLLDSFLKGL